MEEVKPEDEVELSSGVGGPETETESGSGETQKPDDEVAGSEPGGAEQRPAQTEDGPGLGGELAALQTLTPAAPEGREMEEVKPEDAVAGSEPAGAARPPAQTEGCAATATVTAARTALACAVTSAATTLVRLSSPTCT